MGNYQIWIGVTECGEPLISAREIKQREARGVHVVDREQVYGIQLPHRVVGRVNGVFRVLTPTQARKLGATDVCSIEGYQRCGEMTR